MYDKNKISYNMNIKHNKKSDFYNISATINKTRIFIFECLAGLYMLMANKEFQGL